MRGHFVCCGVFVWEGSGEVDFRDHIWSTRKSNSKVALTTVAIFT